ncbi:hypothetical protein [Helicobacter sp. MIT 14-3879]|uniref:hypothetical protein n=1 Tax=Helicobacter sp. MIT 14-3879 TaxID=2040649 RepID=UPI000E1E9E68|nr:hypothetical protein [Helicobacter sp. MIT 14-3879]RDU63136.1 hypothetical protein CQA44_05715 [Helicobacter sp. MIT 14-3879]
MKCIDELKSIGIDKISTRTRITQDKIKNIVECEFNSFDNTRAKGFIQIIQREFNIDMSEWTSAYEEYHKQNELKQDEIKEDSSQDNINNKISIPIDSSKKDTLYPKLVILLFILILLFVLYFAYNNFLLSKAKKISPATNNLDNKEVFYENKEYSDDNSTLENNSTIVDNNSNLVNNDEIENEIENTLQKEDNLMDNANKDDKEETSNDNLNIAESNIINTNEITIIPKEPLWIGVIDLQTYKKKQISTSDKYTIKLDENKIIRTGHSYFDLKGNNISKQYIGGDNKYFLYTDQSGFKEISKQEFLELNRGEEW